jgi:hypothetical protein
MDKHDMQRSKLEAVKILGEIRGLVLGCLRPLAVTQ